MGGARKVIFPTIFNSNFD